MDPMLPGWHALYEEDVTLADHLRERGYFNGLVSDLWHMFKPTMNFHRNFHIWDFVRGQERDGWRPAPKGRHRVLDHLPAHLYDEEKSEHGLWQYLNNTEWFRGEEDYFVARTMRSAARFLENCRDRAPFFLYIDTFDPHEVFDPPKQYAELYCRNYPFQRSIYGYGAKHSAVRREDAEWIRGLYAGKVSLVDTWFGYLMDSIERLGLMDDTVIAFTSDHGTEFFEHGRIQKGATQIYRTVTRIPLLIHAPGAASRPGKQIDALVSAVDIAPTLLRLAGQEPPERATGRDIWPLATGQAESIRDHVAIGYARAGAVRTPEWLLHVDAEPNARFRDGGTTEPKLFDLKTDPDETTDVKDRYPQVRARLLEIARQTWPDAR